jgi:tRNA A-37 threonylcarbamoyl transferase component Bud32
VAASNPGFDSQDGRGCLSTDDVLAHLDRRLEGERLQTVRNHLDGCGACRVVMAEAARIATSTAPGRTPRTLADGETVAGRYQIRRFIARGGMGEVYEAFDSALGETIALKTIVVTAVDQADAVKRLLAEVRIARKVTHPNVCRILEFGTHQRAGSTDEPVPFLTMPLLAGETLARRIERDGRLPPGEALRILRELAAGLAAVHEVGVVHRDFKSDNVFLVKDDDGNERAVVMDFGLARALERRGDKHKTTGRVLIGTPAYMAPEQVEGKAITKAVDIYAFGVVAFELLTGRVPFVAESAAAVALARLQRGAPSPSSIVVGLDKGWDSVIQRCLRRAAEQRYPSVTEMAGALDLLRDGPRRRSWRPATAAGLAAAIAAAAIWFVVKPSRPSSASRAPAAASEAVARAPVAAPATPRPADLPPSAIAPPEPPIPAARTGVAGPVPPRAIKLERAAERAKRSAAPQIASASTLTPPRPPASSHPADVPQPDPTPFARPASPRPRQADDLVDPF